MRPLNWKTAASALVASLSLNAHAAIMKAELAGNPLSQYPYFEYVRAFNTLMTVRVAIDPSRYPAIVGQTCDIDIVKHKSAATWTTNPALVDVTPVARSRTRSSRARSRRIRFRSRLRCRCPKTRARISACPTTWCSTATAMAS